MPLPTGNSCDTCLLLIFRPKGMGCCLFAPAVVFLMIVDCGFQTHHNVTPEGTRTTLRFAEGPEMCPKGTHLEPWKCRNISAGCKCVQCKPGEFQAEPNLDDGCHRCFRCQSKYGQTTVRNCTATQNTECGCEPDHFKIPDFSSGSDSFTCKRCLRCGSLNKTTLQNCSEEADAKCGGCLPGFCSSGGKGCQLCPSILPTLTSRVADKIPPKGMTTQKQFLKPGQPPGMHNNFPPSSQTPEVEACGKDCKFVLISCGLLLVVAVAVTASCFVLYWKRSRWKTFSLPGDAESRMLPDQSCLAPPATLPQPVILTEGTFPHGGALQQGRKLYTIIDAVPVRRWKEFVRGLGLRDGEIELVEVEHSQFREQQYEMLKRWCQKKGASVDTIFAVLEEMQLGGCAQELWEQLQLSRPLRSP